jgi:hypothetical protein
MTSDQWSARLLGWLLAVVIVVGCLVLWIGVPIFGFWLAGQLFTESTRFLMFCLLFVPVTMVGVGYGLYRLNSIYVSLRGGDEHPRSRFGWLVSHTEERRDQRLRRDGRQLIDVAMTASIVTALVLMFVWFFFIAEMRLAPLP